MKPVIQLLAGFPVGGGYAYYDLTTYNDGTAYAPNFISHDISAYGRNEWTINRGITNVNPAGFVAAAGTYDCPLTNVDRRFDPNHLTGPYVALGASLVVPGITIVQKATFAAVTYDMFNGTADDWPQLYPKIKKDQIVDLKATDATQAFANAQQILMRRPVERSGSRIAAILTTSGFQGPTAISPGQVYIGPLTTGTVNGWSHLTDVCNAEWGDLYVAKDGTFTFRDKDAIFSETRSTVSQATFGDGGGAELIYADVTEAPAPIINDVTITYNDFGASVNVQDPVSQSKPWKRRSLPLALPIHDPLVARQYAQWLVTRYAYPLTTFATLVIKPDRDPTNLYPQVLGRELGDRITVILTPLGGGARISRECLIRGIQHHYANNQWTTTFTLADASATAGVGLAIYDINTYNDGSLYW